jgi:hypothetical protein
MAAIAVAGVGLMVVCSSSLAAAMMMGGEEDTPDHGSGSRGGTRTRPNRMCPRRSTLHDELIPLDELGKYESQIQIVVMKL